MYASFDTIDLELEAQDGRARVLQTDHREPFERLANRHQSVVLRSFVD